MKKSPPSSFVAQMVAEFEKHNEQSLATSVDKNTSAAKKKISSPSAAEKPASIKVAPPKPPRTKNQEQSNAHTQQSQSANLKVAPQKPLRPQNKQQNSETTQQNQSAYVRVAPPVPPRTKNQDQSNTQTQQSQGARPKVSPPISPRPQNKQQNNENTQQSQNAYVRVAPPKPPRMKNQDQSNAQTQQSQSANSRVSPPIPPRTKNQEQRNVHTQQSQGARPRVSPPVPPRTKNQNQSNTHTQQSSTTAQQNQSANTKVAPQRPPRAKDKELKNGLTRKDENLYDTPPPQQSSRIRTKRQSSATIQEEDISYISFSSSSETISLSDEEVSRKVQNNALVQACKDQIQYLCKVIYGNPNIFNEKLKEIEKNPMLGDNFAWQVAATPKMMAPLTGKKTLGIKNKERKNAEEKVPDLGLAVENFSHAVRQAKDGIDRSRKSEHTLRRGTLDLKQMAEVLQKPRTTEQQWVPLTDKELIQRATGDTMVQYCHSEITYWCKAVFNNPNILQERLKDIQKVPEMAEELAWQVTTHPGFFGKLAGRNFHGFKNTERKLAENGLAPLGEAIEGYAEAIKQAKENILETHQAKRKHHEASLEQAQGSSKQQTLKTPKLSEHTPSRMHHEAGETSRQAENRSHNAHSKKVEASKASALAI